MNIITKNIPNAITCLNLAAGFAAIMFAAHAAEPFGSMLGWQWAALCIGIAAVADFCDGFSARLLRAYSNLGKELDSLCDLISFGVAPAAIIFNILLLANAPLWLLCLTVMIPICGALRLARFNIDTHQTTDFIGMPIPANAIFWVGYAAGMMHDSTFMLRPATIACAIVIVSLLMVSSQKMVSLKFKNLNFRENIKRYLVIAAFIISVAVYKLEGLWVGMCCYYIISLVKISFEVRKK